MYMGGLRKEVNVFVTEHIGLRLQDSPAALLDFRRTFAQPGKELTDFFLHLGGGAQAPVRGNLLARPVPDRLVGVEVRAISGQSDQAQLQVRRSEKGPNGLAAMGRGIGPGSIPRFRRLF